uniref:Uncharacterized protein n=1 Tax=Strongyloides stercoralis TaxID=6248 RepID=A0A0K0DZ06_STRER
MRFIIFAFFVLFFIGNNCYGEQNQDNRFLDFTLDILKKLTFDGIDHLLKIGKKEDKGSAPINVIDILKLFGNESKEIKEKIEKNKDKLSSDTVIEKLPHNSVNILEKIKKIKEKGDSKEEQDKKIEKLLKKPENSMAVDIIGLLVKKVIGL